MFYEWPERDRASLGANFGMKKFFFLLCGEREKETEREREREREAGSEKKSLSLSLLLSIFFVTLCFGCGWL